MITVYSNCKAQYRADIYALIRESAVSFMNFSRASGSVIPFSAARSSRAADISWPISYSPCISAAA